MRWPNSKYSAYKIHEVSNDQILAILRYNAKLKKTVALIDAQTLQQRTLKDGKVIGFRQYVATKQLDVTLNEQLKGNY